MKGAPSALAALALAGCVMVPHTVDAYDPECRTVARRMELQPLQIAALGGCSNQGCLALLATAGVTAAVSTVVSGSIVIIGNTIYWLERAGTCQRNP